MKKFYLPLGDDLMNPNNPNQPNTAGIKIGLPNSSNKGFDVKAGIIDSNPNATYNPNNNIKLYDSKDTYNRIPFAEVIMCNIDCQEFLKNATTLNTQNNIESTTNTESAHQNNTNQPPFFSIHIRFTIDICLHFFI